MTTTMGMQYIPEKLDHNQSKVILYLLKMPKAAKIIVRLCDKKSSYLNEIQEAVGGSKTSTMEILKSLEDLKIIKSSWQIEDVGNNKTPRKRATKTFLLSEEKEKLIEFYEPLFRKITS